MYIGIRINRILDKVTATLFDIVKPIIPHINKLPAEIPKSINNSAPLNKLKSDEKEILNAAIYVKYKSNTSGMLIFFMKEITIDITNEINNIIAEII